MKRMTRWVLPALLVVVLAGLYLFQQERRRQRIEDYSSAAYQYGRYERAYTLYADRKNQDYFMETCFGGKWDRYSDDIYRDLEAHSKDEAYLRNKSTHFANLKKKYESALSKPEVEIALDPPLGP